MKHWEVLEADFQAVYQVDLTGVFTQELTLRRCAVLLQNLPPGSLFRRYRGGALSWSEETSAIFAMGHRLEAMMVLTNGGKKKDIPEPIKPPEEGWVEKEEQKAYLREQRARRWLAAHPPSD